MADVNGRAQYRRGSELERRCRAELIEAGYFVVRSAGSKTPVDLCAVKPGQVLFVQCKRNGALPAGQWNDLYGAAVTSGALPVLAEQLTRGRRYWLLTGTKKARQRAMLPREELHIDLPGMEP